MALVLSLLLQHSLQKKTLIRLSHKSYNTIVSRSRSFNNMTLKTSSHKRFCTEKRGTFKFSNFLIFFLQRRQLKLPGVSLLVNPKLTRTEKCLWAAFLVFMVCMSWQIGKGSLNRYYYQSTMMGWDRDFYYWNSSLPSITVCPLVRLNRTLFDSYCSAYNITGAPKLEFFTFLESLANSTYTNFKQIYEADSIDSTLHKLAISPNMYMPLIYNLTGDIYLDSQTVHSFSDNTYLDTRQILTEYGLCYMTNSKLPAEYTSHFLIFGEFAETKDKITPNNVRTINYFTDQPEYNIRGFGQMPFDSFIHSPFEVMQMDRSMGYSTTPIFLIITSLDIVTSDDFERGAKVYQRKCRFTSESNLLHFPFYTERLCVQEYRLKLVYEKCGCIPHFYPNRFKTVKPVCHYKMLISCVAAYAGLFLKDPECDCMQLCRNSIINVRTISTLNATALLHGNSVTVSAQNAPTIRLKRQIIFSFTDFLVSLSSVVGLFFGLCLLNLIELIYVLAMDLYWYLRGYDN